MKILYIAEDLFNSSVHENLCRGLLKTSDCFITGYKVDRYGDYSDSMLSTSNSEVLRYNLPNRIKWRYRCSFGFKSREKTNWLIKNKNISEYDLIHSSTLFSDGIVAYQLYKIYKIPYVVAVRSTDIDLYCKYFFHLWSTGKKIIENASHVVFITPNLHKKFCSSYFCRLTGNLLIPNFSIIPNGVSQVWLNNIVKKQPSNSHKIIYIGKFNSNKNVEKLMKAVERLSNKYIDIHLTLIGGGGNKHKDILRKILLNPRIFTYKGQINDKNQLIQELRENSIFAMVSHSETFGLVYIEALSQGLRLLYTKHQGIDNFFKERIGEAVNSHSLEEIVNSLDKLLSSPEDYVIPADLFTQFSWDNIALEYKSIYLNIIEKNIKN